MPRRVARFVVSLFLVFTCIISTVNAQTLAQTDIYEHFIGTWVGTDAYMKDGASRKIGVKIVITETKKKDRLRLDYDYGKKANGDPDRETRFLKLDPTKAEFELRWEDSSKETYKATGLDEFAKSGFGKFAGSQKNSYGPEQDRVFRVIFELTRDMLRYEWQQGPDENHLVFRSIFTLSRFAVTAQP